MTDSHAPSTEMYRKLILLMIHSKRGMFEILEAFDLTPAQGTLLMLFNEETAISMHHLSTTMGCDASNITGLVDRLDSQGLIERTSNPADRRVKLITLSSKGIECRKQILLSLQKAEAADLGRLTKVEQDMFIKIIDKLTAR